jgi:hypothetical protein
MIPTNARKKFSSDVTPSDRQLWAIGMVIVRWTIIEQMIKIFVHAFTDENDPNDPVRRLFDSTRPMQLRLDQWEELSKAKLQSAWVGEMLDLIAEVRNLTDMRDKIVHGTWADAEKAKTAGVEAHGSFSWGKPGHSFSWKLTYGDILAVALRMDKLHTGMFNFALRASGVQRGEPFTVGSALRRIQIAPSQPS